MEKREGREREEQRTQGQREVRVASRTLCPGWPRREAGRSVRSRVGAKRREEKAQRGERKIWAEREHHGKETREKGRKQSRIEVGCTSVRG